MSEQLGFDGMSLDQQIAHAEADYVQACHDRQGNMSDGRLRARVNDLRDLLNELKRMRIDLKRIADKAEADARASAYQAKKAQDAADLKAKGVRLRRLDDALFVLVEQYFSLNPGSYCTSHISNQLVLIKGRCINEARRPK